VLQTKRSRASIIKIAEFWKIGLADAAELVLAVESRQNPSSLPSFGAATEAIDTSTP
jgi:hypothetical protein